MVGDFFKDRGRGGGILGRGFWGEGIFLGMGEGDFRIGVLGRGGVVRGEG